MAQNLKLSLSALFPGIAAATFITAVSVACEKLELSILNVAWIDGLVFAILIGTAYNTIVGLHPRLVAGVQFSAKTLLEVAIVLLGASISFSTIADAGMQMVAIVAAVVIIALTTSYAIGRMLGLSDRLATLVACGNSICGNSAIVAAAPVIEARSDEVAASIAFTAALGIVVVLVLPLASYWLGLGQWQYGVVAGLTVYAVPQVLAATIPVGALSTQVGALVKLMRVLMLGPVVLLLGLKAGRKGDRRLPVSKLVPWFILGFLAMMAGRSAGLLPEHSLPVFKQFSTLLTIISMAALGLSVNLRTVMSSGGRVLAAGVLSLAVLAALAGITLAILPSP